MYIITLRHYGATIDALEKQLVLHILSVFVALSIQHEMCMRRIVICGLPRLYGIFLHYLIPAGFWKEVFEHKMCVLIFSKTSV